MRDCQPDGVLSAGRPDYETHRRGYETWLVPRRIMPKHELKEAPKWDFAQELTAPKRSSGAVARSAAAISASRGPGASVVTRS